MTDLLSGLISWLHALATAMFVGYFLLLWLVYLPALDASPESVRGPVVGAVSKRSRNWLYAALITLFATGAWLTFVDSNYLGLANFGNVWGILMLTKHLVILAMLGIGLWYNAILRIGPMAASSSGASQALRHFRSYAVSMSLCAMLVLLLTALGQAQ